VTRVLLHGKKPYGTPAALLLLLLLLPLPLLLLLLLLLLPLLLLLLQWTSLDISSISHHVICVLHVLHCEPPCCPCHLTFASLLLFLQAHPGAAEGAPQHWPCRKPDR
jgi:hypothetical protein